MIGRKNALAKYNIRNNFDKLYSQSQSFISYYLFFLILVVLLPSPAFRNKADLGKRGEMSTEKLEKQRSVRFLAKEVNSLIFAKTGISWFILNSSGRIVLTRFLELT